MRGSDEGGQLYLSIHPSIHYLSIEEYTVASSCKSVWAWWPVVRKGKGIDKETGDTLEGVS